MSDCIFCKIIKGEIPSNVVFEDDILTVFMDINPDTNGHMLVVPKKHITDFTELDNDTAMHINEVVKEMKDKIYNKLNPDGLRLINNYGIYQLVKHYHLHIIPCYKETQKKLSVDEVYNKLMN